MPNDDKRITPPEKTFPYQLFTKLNTKSFIEKFRGAVNPETGERSDGRKVNDQRKIYLNCDVVSQAQGSAYIEVNKTKLIASVFDPKEISKRNDYKIKGELYCEFKYAPFSCPKRKLHIQDAEEKQNSAIIKRALESAVCQHEFPNFQVDIHVYVIENDGSVLSAAIIAAGLALAQAGIPMYDLIVSVTLGIQGNVCLVDPTLEEQNLCNTAIKVKDKEQGYERHGVIVLSVLAKQQQISQIYQTGCLSLNDINEGVQVLKTAMAEIIPLIKKRLIKHTLKKLKDNP